MPEFSYQYFPTIYYVFDQLFLDLIKPCLIKFHWKAVADAVGWLTQYPRSSAFSFLASAVETIKAKYAISQPPLLLGVVTGYHSGQ